VNRRWLRAAVVLIALGLLLVAVAPSGLNAVGRWLMVADPVDKASAIVVLVGYMPFRAMEAAALYGQGWAPEVWVTQEDRSSRDTALRRLGIDPYDWASRPQLSGSWPRPSSIRCRRLIFWQVSCGGRAVAGRSS
jgi:hypothetical protein